ncbi:MAG: diguanylate cyclase [Coriobacteriales bacterium]
MSEARRSKPTRRPHLPLLALLAFIVYWLGVSFIQSALDPAGGRFIDELLSPSPPTLFGRMLVAVMALGGGYYTQRLIDQHAMLAHELDHERYKLQLVYDHNPTAILIIDAGLTVTYANPVAEQLVGLPAAEMKGKPCHEAVLNDGDGPCDGCLLESAIASGVPQVAVKHQTAANGRDYWVERMWYPVFAHDGVVESVVEISKDITDVKRAELAMPQYSKDLEESVRVRTEALERANADLTQEISERRRAEKALRESEERFRSLVELAPDLILVHIEGIITFINPYGAQLLGYDQSAQLLGIHVMDLVDTDSRDIATSHLRTTVHDRQPISPAEICFVRRDGSRVDIRIAATPLVYHGRAAVQAVGHDITDRKRAEETIRRMAYYDPLTGLPNRALFDDRLGLAVAHAQREDIGFAVMFMDMDDFKGVNDAYGHSVGDELLVEVARRLSRIVRRSDTVARLGGDEFTVLLPKVHSRQAAAQVARKISRVMEEPALTSSGPVPIELSIGIAFYPADGKTFSQLMHAADMAMYACKNEGVPFRFADPGVLTPRQVHAPD